jgi:hypothetical protein
VTYLRGREGREGRRKEEKKKGSSQQDGKNLGKVPLQRRKRTQIR